MDLNLIAVAIVVNIVVFIICYLYFGNRRELSFEEALAELEGLNILLSKNNADQDHGKKMQKEAKKKKMAAAAAASVKKNPKKKAKLEDRQQTAGKPAGGASDAKKSTEKIYEDDKENVGDRNFDETADNTEQYQATTHFGEELATGDLSTASEAVRKTGGSSTGAKRNKKEQPKIDKLPSNNGNKFEYLLAHTEAANAADENRSDDELKSSNQPIDVEERVKDARAQNQEQTQLDSFFDDTLKEDAESLEEDHPQDPSALVPVVVSEPQVQPVVQNPNPAAQEIDSKPVPSKKKKSKSSKSAVKRSAANVEPAKPVEDSQNATTASYDTVDARVVFIEDSSLNSVLRRLGLPVLNEAQLEIVSDFYCNPSSTGYSSSLSANCQKLKKDLDESQAHLAQTTQKLTVALQSLKDLNQEVINEKQRFSMMEASMKDQLTLKQNENQNLSQKIREFQTQLTSKMQAYRQMEAQVLQCRIEQGNAAQAQQLREENQRLKERINNVEQEIHSRNADLQRLKQELMGRDNQVHRLEQQRQEMDQRRVIQDASLTQQMMDNQNKMMQKDQECGKLQEEIKVLQKEINLLQQDHKMLRQQLTEKDNRVQALSHQNAIDNETKKELERVRAECIEFKETHNKDINKYKNLKEEIEADFTKRLRATEDQYNRITEDKDLEIVSLKKELDTLNQDNIRNDALRHKELESAFNAINKLDAEIVQLKNKLNLATAKLQERENVAKDLQAELKCVQETRDKALKIEKPVENVEQEQIPSPLVNGMRSTVENGHGDFDKEPQGVVLSKEENRPVGEIAGVIVEKSPSNCRQVCLEWFNSSSDSIKSVEMKGSHNNWAEPTVLQKDPQNPERFFTDLSLPFGRYEFKFIVDGKWLCSDRYDICRTESAENNFIYV